STQCVHCRAREAPRRSAHDLIRYGGFARGTRAVERTGFWSKCMMTDASSSGQTGENAPSMLLVDDDEIFRTRLARALVRRGYEVSEAGSYDEAMKTARA